MTDFFRFPHTPHLAWLGPGQPRDDKVLDPVEAGALLAGDIVVEEKVDGANVGFSLDEHGNLRVQNRGAYLQRDGGHLQFKPLFRWLAPRADRLLVALRPNLMLFGEWCWAVHSVRYEALTDWFLAFDIYDRDRGHFWCAKDRDDLVRGLGLELVPQLARGRFDLLRLQGLLTKSRLGAAPMEGLYVRRDAGDRLLGRAKLVRGEFTQAIDEHWSRRQLEHNQLASGKAWH